MEFTDKLFSQGNLPSPVAGMGKELAETGMKRGFELGTTISDFIDEVVDAIFK